MTNVLLVSFIAFLFTGSAWPLSRLFPLANKYERLGVSFLLGSGLNTFLWFLLYLLGLPFSFPSLIASCCLITTFGLYSSKKVKQIKESTKEKWLKLDKFLFAIIMIALVLVIVIGNYFPITAWDSMALYDSRAHMIVQNHTLKDITDTSYYLSYPLFVSLLHAATYFAGASNPQVLHALLFAAFLTIVFGRLSSWTNLRFALIGTMLNLFIYEMLFHASISYANLAYTVFLTAGFFYAVSGDTHTRSRFLILAGFMLGLSAWVRTTEVFWALGVLVILYAGYRHRVFKAAVASVILFAIFRQTWAWFYQYHAQFFPEPPLTPAPLFSRTTILGIWHNLPQIIVYLKRYIIYPYLGFWGMAMGIVLLSFKSPGKLRALSFFIFGSLFVAVAGTAIFSTFFTTWFSIGDSARRMLMFLSPLTMTSAVLMLYQIKGKYVR